jgi:hypothetical protein
LVTASNDETVKESVVRGDGLALSRTITVSDRYLYSLNLLDDEMDVVSSEDRCAYIVSSIGQAVADVLPMCGSVWGADVLSNGDVITVFPDGFVRVFTPAPERKANPDVESAYFTNLEDLTFNNPELQEVNRLGLPDMEALVAEPPVAGRATLIRYGEVDVSVVIWSPIADRSIWAKS